MNTEKIAVNGLTLARKFSNNEKFSKENTNKPLPFVQVSRDKGFVAFSCTCCNKQFGLDAEWMEEVSELNFYHACPYCGTPAPVDN